MRHLKLAPNWLRFLIIVVLVVGVFFRFLNLDGKVYWHDETFTSLRISGYTAAEVKQQIFNNHVITREAFAKFQRPNPEKGLSDTIKSLAIEDPQHPPLYYIIARFWVQIFGNSVTAIRSLSAFLSLLVFPCVYWLCRELFTVPLSVPYLAIALMAISPLHLAYAQEAREYILWAVTVLLSSASLLRAMRLESKRQLDSERILTWGIYAATLALSLYTFLLSGFVAVAHGIYVTAIKKHRWTKTVKAYFLASLAAFLAFTPWLIVLLVNFSQFRIATAWTAMKLPLVTLIQSWLMQNSRIFFDLDFGFENPLSYLITLIFLILVGYSIYFLYRTTHPKVWLFIVTLIAVPALPLMLPDLIFGGVRSLAERYLMPSYLGIQLAVAYLLANHLYNGSLLRRRIWETIMVLMIIGGVVSCGVSSQAETWWSKNISYGNPQVARIINQADSPLLMSDASEINYGNVFSLSYLLQPKVRFLLIKDKNIPKIPQGFSNVFLLNPSPKLRKEIEKKYKSKESVVYQDNHYSVFKLAKP
ncbi:MAG: glycosyltransferase family 39 protein [Stigonema ocellatum SAG 48.90 = DSM 106950]|nr:glycosyltransferase family 39 protein [Stigonema ocellatum SAG 48.90 = DSM 106950]